MKEEIIKNLKRLLNDKEVTLSCATLKIEKSIEQTLFVQCDEDSVYINFFTSLKLDRFQELDDLVKDVMYYVNKFDATFDEKYEVHQELRASFNQIRFPVSKLYLDKNNVESIQYLPNNVINIYIKDLDKHVNKIRITIKN